MQDRADNANSRTIEPGIIQRVVSGISGAWQFIRTGEVMPEFFGPRQPLPPIAPPDVAGRQLDYPVGYNLRIRPREGEAVTFDSMRQLSDNWTLLRSVIETRKDQLVKLTWGIKTKEGFEVREKDPRIKELISFYQSPDQEHSWQQWLRMLVEDMLVIDAPCLYPRMTKGGGLYALEPVDGATIKRVLDYSGRTPTPPEPAYQQILKGLPAVNYIRDELIYYPRNIRTNKVYGFSPVEQCIMIINIGLRRDLSQLQYYTEGNIPDAFINVPEDWTPDQIAQFQTYWDSILEGNTEQRRKAKFIPGKMAPTFTADPKLKDEYDEWLARIVCFCFSITAMPFIRQVNRASGETMKETALEEGLNPLMEWIKDLINLTIVKYHKYDDLEFSWNEEKDVDPLKQAQIIDLKIRNGTMSINQSRELDEYKPDPDGNDLFIMTAQGPVKLKDAFSNDGGNGGSGTAPRGTTTAAASTDVNAAKLAKAKKKIFRPPNLNRQSVMKAVRSLKKVYTKFFKAASKDIAGQISAAMQKVEKADEDTVTRILESLDLSGWAVLFEPTAEQLEKIYLEAAKHGITNLTSLNLPLSLSEEGLTDVLSETASRYARERAAEMVGRKLVNGELIENPNPKWAITETTREELRSLVSQAIDEGWSPAHLSKEVEGAGLFDEDRAEMIARTEVKIADSKGNMESYRESGLALEKSWDISADHSLMDECDENEEAGWIDINDVFPSGDDVCPSHPNCDCANNIRVKEE